MKGREEEREGVKMSAKKQNIIKESVALRVAM